MPSLARGAIEFEGADINIPSLISPMDISPPAALNQRASQLAVDGISHFRPAHSKLNALVTYAIKPEQLSAWQLIRHITKAWPVDQGSEFDGSDRKSGKRLTALVGVGRLCPGDAHNNWGSAMQRLIKVSDLKNIVKTIDAKTFERTFKVRYAQELLLPADLPADFLNTCAQYAADTVSIMSKQELHVYRNYINAGRVSPVYIGLIDSIMGHGLFAAADISAGEIIGEYTGVLSHTWVREVKKAEDINPYLFKYPFESNYAIDAQNEGNELRFANHSLQYPNIERRYIPWEGILRVVFFANQHIMQNQQLLFNYGEGYWRFRLPQKIVP